MDFQHKQQLEQAVRQHADMIYRIALQSTKNKADAEDIFQEICLLMMTKNPPLDDEAHLKHWLIRATVNKCKSFHRSAWQRRTEGLDESLTCCPADNDVAYELDKLPAKYRTVVYLHYYEGYSTAEIGEMLGKSPNTVCTWLARARKKLKDSLS